MVRWQTVQEPIAVLPQGLPGNVSACLLHAVFLGGMSHWTVRLGSAACCITSAARTAVYVVAATSVLVRVVCIMQTAYVNNSCVLLRDKALIFCVHVLGLCPYTAYSANCSWRLQVLFSWFSCTRSVAHM